MKKVIGKNDDTRHDFLAHYTPFLLLTGYSDQGNVTFVMRILVYVYNYVTQALAVLVMVYVDEIEPLVLSIRAFVLCMYFWWMIGSRIMTNKSLMNAREMILSGVYRYEGEEETKDSIYIRRNGVDKMKKRIKVVIVNMWVIAFTVVLVSLSQVFFMKEGEVSREKHILNPMYPAAFYIPWDTYTPVGFAFGMVVNLINIMFMFGMGSVVFQFYYSCLGQIGLELRVLSHSLTNIQERARLMYFKSHLDADKATRDMFSATEFGDYLYKCLRSNVLHHQAILRLHNEVKTYCGSVVFISVSFAPLLFACSLYLILTNPTGEIYKLALYIFIFMGELPYNFFLCYIGEELIQDFIHFRETLYAIPWYHCNKRFNVLLITMMRYSTKPIALKALLIRVTISLEAFGDLMSGMFKIMNLWRQKEK